MRRHSFHLTIRSLRANEVELDQYTIGRAALNACCDTLQVGSKQIVADNLYFVPDGLHNLIPTLPVGIGGRIFD